MKIRWQYNIDTEIRRVVFTAEQIKALFYQKSGFLILPYVFEGNPRSVYFPDFEYKKFNHFWKKVPSKKMIHQMSQLRVHLPPEVKNKLEVYIKKEMLTRDEISRTKKSWQKVEKDFLKMIQELFDLHHIDIIIRPTRFGSLSSHRPSLVKGKKSILIYFRIDQDISHLAEGILTSLLILNMKRTHLLTDDLWQKIEVTSDYLLYFTKLHKLFPKFTQTLSILENDYYNKKVIEESRVYVQKLGFNVFDALKVQKNSIYVGTKKISEKEFSQVEKQILVKLINNKGEIVTFDQIAEIIWGKEVTSHYSLWAIAKKIERIRKKLKEIGFYCNVLETRRKKGYLLIN